LGIKFFQHFVYVTAAMRKGAFRDYDMWNEEDGFFYTHLRYPGGQIEEIKMRSLVGLIPFFATDSWKEEELKQFPDFYASYRWIVEKRPDIASKCIQIIPNEKGNIHLFGLLNSHETEKLLQNVWNPEEFRSDYGLRSVSKFHEKNPIRLREFSAGYEPAEALRKIKGGNSNWRGPIWFPINYFLIDTLHNLSGIYKNSIQVKVPGEKPVTLEEMAKSFSNRLLDLFKKDPAGKRPSFGDTKKFQEDPNFKDYILFFEYFHGDNGRGLGASHQTGWTGLIANLIDDLRKDSP